MDQLKKTQRKYTIELLAALVAYIPVLFLSITYLKANPESAWRIPIAIAPVLPAALIPLIVVRYIRRLDELERRITLEALGFAFGCSAVGTLAIGFLENAGFPRLSWTFVWPIMGLFWCVGKVLATRRYR
jgi:hypothetical protein